jgi:RHS repeat-associated protein
VTLSVPAGKATAMLKVVRASVTSNEFPFEVGIEGHEYVHVDAIGSVRMITGYQGSVLERHDFLPFGEEWPPRPDPAHVGFGGKEVDKETETSESLALSYFGARHLHEASGRFTSPDPVAFSSARLTDPQLANRYSYVRSNTLYFVDPDGREPLPASLLQFYNLLFHADFSKVDIQDGKFGQTAAENVAGQGGAVTLRNTIFLSEAAKTEYRARTIDGLALMGHELTHVVQYNKLTTFGFLDTYFGEYATNRVYGGDDHYTAYENIPHERKAKSMQDYIAEFLMQHLNIYEKLRTGQDLSSGDKLIISAQLTPMFW